MKIILTISTLLLLNGCATKHLTSKVNNPEFDAFKEESFLRYTNDRLDRLEKSEYSALSECYAGNPDKGLSLLKEVRKEQQMKAEYWNQVGVCYFLKDNISKADFYFELSLQKNPKYSPAKNNLGVLSLKNRHFERALTLFKEAAQGKYKVPQFNETQIYLEFGLYDQAISLLNDLLKTNDSDPDILYGLAMAYIAKGDLKSSQQIYKKLPQSFLEREDITLIRAVTLYEEKKLYEARDLLRGKNFLEYVPLKKSAQKLEKILNHEIKLLEEREAKAKEAGA